MKRRASVLTVHRGADDPSHTGHAGLLLVRNLNSKLHLVERRGAAMERVRQFQQRRRGLSGGELLVSRAESILAGGSRLAHLGPRREDEAATCNYEGKLSFGSLLCTWAERRRVLAAGLRSGSASDKPIAPRLVLRALRALPQGHGEARLRADSGFYRAGFLSWCRGHRPRFCVLVPHYQVVRELRRRISFTGRRPCREMAGAEVAELRFTPPGWQHEPLRLLVRRVRVEAKEISQSPRSRRRSSGPCTTTLRRPATAAT